MELAIELKALLQQFNKGVKDVKISEGIVCVYVSSRKAAIGVITDLGLSGGFSSMRSAINAETGKGFIIFATPRSRKA